ncbi:PspA/IM30 family protein [Paenibacillus sp. SYP-B4298]|uniref:PspA/IM30 family protein n=1 Tax=Paenibacillus sp. SYP-B4298 TaxID=2996034 RepID=UPI0022DDB264|nr:PspA/IM30 family protein [Paenibacillus sp. SYP-B4298]
MGMLSRFRDIMRSNVNAWQAKSEDPEKAVDEYMRALSRDLGQVRAENATVQMEERRARRALEECRAEIAKLQRYAERSVQAGNEAEALRFLERKAQQSAQEQRLLAAYEQAAAGAEGMKRMEQKLAGDLASLEARRAMLREKLAAARAQERLNALGAGGGTGALQELEERANKAYDEAMALAELRAGQQPDDLDELIARLVESQEQAGGSAGSAGGYGTGSGAPSPDLAADEPGSTAATSESGPAGAASAAGDAGAAHEPDSRTAQAASPQEELAALRSKLARS